MRKNVSPKTEVTKVVNQLAKKAQSWGQVTKQLSRMSGKIALKDRKISILEAFRMLGVEAKSNIYTPQMFNAAWSEKLKENKQLHNNGGMGDDSWVCPLIVRPIAQTVKIGKDTYKLHVKTDGGYEPLRLNTLCRVVKAEDKVHKTDVVVTAKVVLQGLVQSLYADEYVKMIEDDKERESKLTEAYVDITPQGDSRTWIKVVKNADYGWKFAK